MYKLSKRIEVAGSHQLNGLDYESPCENLHGHNWIIVVEVEGLYLNSNGMLIDFKHIKDVVNLLDHTDINKYFNPQNPTAENIARWLCLEIQDRIDVIWKNSGAAPTVTKISVQESEGNIACYIP
jgi:6-pyruvoyltetrahydropterin/6-carboxytetrahydropterin synthase